MDPYSTLVIARERQRDLTRAAAAVQAARDPAHDRRPAAAPPTRTDIRRGSPGTGLRRRP